MTCLGCVRLESGDDLKTLHDGRSVCNICPDWILECEAVELLRLPLQERRKRLAAFTDARSGVAMDSLKERLTALHSSKQRHL